MTPEEAIKTIKAAQAEVEWEYPMDYAVAFDVAIKALEKQIPKKVKIQFCEMGSETDVCPFCGQALDWSDGDAKV